MKSILILYLLFATASYAQSVDTLVVQTNMGDIKQYVVSDRGVFNTKLNTNGNGSQLTGITPAQVGAQTALVSGTTIKTVNGNNILGSGDISISSAVAWGGVTGTLSNQSDLNTVLGGKEPTISAGITAQYWRGDKTWQTLNSSAVGLGNVTNESKATMFTNPAFTGTTTGITATMVGLGNVTNESKATMFTNAVFTGTFNVADGSIANADLANAAVANLSGTNTGDNATNTQYSGLAASKANVASPAFTGTPTGIGLPVYAQVTGANVTTTGQALVDITGLSIALVANAIYEFEAVMSVSTSAVTTGTAYGVNYSAAGAAVEAQITGASTSTASKTLRINALNSATTLYLATSAQTGGIVIKGRVTTGANAGNFTVSHLKLTSGTSTVFIGSFLKVTRIS